MSDLKSLTKRLRALAELKVITENKEQIQILAMNETEALIKRRVFLEGKDNKGNEISTYSTEPIYVNPHKLPKLVAGDPLKKNLSRSNAAIQKANKKREVERKERKTVYLSGGYAELKSKLNFDPNIYNLTLTGASKDSLKVGRKGSNIVFGYSNKEKKEILEGHEERLNKKIFSPNAEERKFIQLIVKANIARLIQKTMHG